MASQPTMSLDIRFAGEARLTRLIVASVSLHVFFLLILPLATQFIWHSKKFERPATFELVRMPPAAAQRMSRPKAVEPTLVPAKTPKSLAKKAQAKPVPKKQEAQPQENLDELASLLDELPAPARLSARGDFKYHWYLNSVQGRIEGNWVPGIENKNLSVVVAFTIFSNGSISDVRVRTSSGNGTLDNMAVRAVKLSAPFGQLPAGFTGNEIEIELTLKPIRK
jgi:TonB family protein